MTLEPGDVLFIYTDGLAEARNRRGAAFGVDRLDAAIREGAAYGADGVHHKVMDSWTKFLGRKRIDDDVTVVVLGRSRDLPPG